MGLKIDPATLADWERKGLIVPDHKPCGKATNRVAPGPEYLPESSTVRLTITLPARVQSESNLREHWSKKHARAKSQFETVMWGLLNWASITSELGSRLRNGQPVSVTFTRIGGKKLDVGDNLPAAFKACRDAVAKMVGVDDGHPGYQWHYTQEPGGKTHAIRITLEG